MFADYAYYTNSYFGNSIKEDDFPRLEMRAGEQIIYLTNNKVETALASDAVKNAVCAVAEVLNTHEQMSKDTQGNPIPGPIRSEKVGGLSISYAVDSNGKSELSSRRQAEIYSAAKLYLASTGLLYSAAVLI